MNHYKETTKREGHRAIDVIGGEGRDVLKCFRSKSHDRVATLMREVYPIDDSDHHEVQSKKTNTTPRPIPRVEQIEEWGFANLFGRDDEPTSAIDDDEPTSMIEKLLGFRYEEEDWRRTEIVNHGLVSFHREELATGEGDLQSCKSNGYKNGYGKYRGWIGNRHLFGGTLFCYATRVNGRSRYLHCVKRKRLVAKMSNHEGEVVTLDFTSGNMICEPVLEEGVFRFDCSRNAKGVAFPSLSFINSKVRDTSVITQKVPSYIPTFDCSQGQQIVKIEFPIGTSFYGTGEVSGQLERTGKRIFTWNTDAWGYGPGTTSLYQSHPWVFVLLPNGEALGVLADTTRRCEIDLREDCTIKITAPASYPILTFGPFVSPTAVLISLSHAIGTIFMPPKWSLGYHQCRWSYESDAIVLKASPSSYIKGHIFPLYLVKLSKTFREKGIPCDVIWMDIDYMDGFRCFTFDKDRFSDPKSLVSDLHQNGFKAIWMLDPGIKQEDGYSVYDSGSENDVWILKSDGKPYVGEVWPGPCVFPDFTQEKARLWWAKLVKDFTSNGVDGIWNDMNEPAVFKTVTKTMPDSNIHRGDAELGGPQNHLHYHNVLMVITAVGADNNTVVSAVVVAEDAIGTIGTGVPVAVVGVVVDAVVVDGVVVVIGLERCMSGVVRKFLVVGDVVVGGALSPSSPIVVSP
ncbi:hypothetical protein GIB67_040870 [Kingdonia uniflora]|uniref:Uncharacterized protein n=1 Tax=Kingdonia uniflora TaxID=39325 RepID=A0A7J7L874_9MAGN|nr:hypothetical protein GIB67_040870 [Kingdonia uniflora]